MNRSILKKYAPQARRDFIQAVTDRASYYGLTTKETEPVTVQGDTALIGGQAFPKKVAEQRKRLEERIARRGFEQVMEAVAYTWFNRLVAIRFMELHGYLEHGYRVLSHPSGGSTPEILEHADSVDLPGLDPQQVIDLKLAGNKDSELYRMLLIAQCNALHSAMPFLFERIDDETELLLPDNLLHSDSLIRTLVSEIPEEDWQEVEIIGWLYQFYISEKKDQVIGKVVKSEDIPAATQLFTPNWIVKYLVQNSLGRQWVATYPNSPLKGEMEYYIEPAEQTPEVQQQLKAITPDSLDPEQLTLLDPACGSGHILVEAYDLLKAIYQERGYPKKDIPRLILTKNLYGLEIDDRAAQLAAFALMMKARADDRRIFAQGIQPHVLSIQESKGLDAKEITEALNAPLGGKGEAGDISQADVAHLIDLFEHGKTFGSLIQVPKKLAERLSPILLRTKEIADDGDLLQRTIGRLFHPIVQQSLCLARQYSCVAANPPYMGSRYHNAPLKSFLKENFKSFQSDLFSAFVVQLLALAKESGDVAFMAPNVWMFISTHEPLRERLLHETSLQSLVQLSTSGFDAATVHICATTTRKVLVKDFCSSFIRLTSFRGTDAQPTKTIEAIQSRDECEWFYHARPATFAKVPGSPFAFWISPHFQQLFESLPPLKSIAEPRVGLQTGDNAKFVRLWYEVDVNRIHFGCKGRDEAARSQQRWFLYNKGGDFRKWFGNNEHVVNWENDGHEIRNFTDSSGSLRSRPQNLDWFFRPCVTWSFISSSYFGVRQSSHGFAFDVAGSSAFPNPELLNVVTGFLCSHVAFEFMKVMNPTLNFQVGNVALLPFAEDKLADRHEEIDLNVEEAMQIARLDWNSHETAWDFTALPLLAFESNVLTVKDAYDRLRSELDSRIVKMRKIEEQNNREFVAAYHLESEIDPSVTEDQVTLYRPDREEDIQRLISYAIGCMMGRYSLDKPGLIYAHSGGEGFDPSQYQTFPADSDGIIPITEFEWFEDDAVNRLEEFIATAWPHDHLEENLKFIAESIGQKKSESARDAIRRYLSTGFCKQHLSLYKKRPIYWLFSSGKQRAFQCLVYLHRLGAGTLSRMRTEYVIPLQGKIESRIDQLELDIEAASSTSHQKKLTKERDTLVKHREELQTFDEKLRHHADQRITLDLDDGVKVNYGKFGDLLAEVKAITGQKPD